MSIPEWYARAECRGLNPDLFYPRWGVISPEAAATCAHCGVRPECLEAGKDEAHGTWGGISEVERLTKMRAAMCAHCGSVFEFPRRPGQPPRYCSAACVREHRRTKYRQEYGYMRARGHGKISRYVDGCRCGPCRVAAREARRRYPRAVA